MRKSVVLTLLFLTFNISSFVNSQASTQCFITNKPPAKVFTFQYFFLILQPKPSLIQCYKNNPSSCCNSLADKYISDVYSTLLSKSCARLSFYLGRSFMKNRSYPWLESYFCLACNPAQPLSTNTTTKVIKVCKSLMNSLWASDLTTVRILWV